MNRMAYRLVLLAASLLVASFVAAQAPARGELLVATEQLQDPRFARSVVLLLHYDQNGALGLMINRPTWVAPAGVFPEFDFLSEYRGHIYIGGPVAPTNIAFLFRNPDPAARPDQAIFGDVYLSTDQQFLREAAPNALGEDTLRLFAGHAGWGAGQLEQEIARGDWQLMPARAELVFHRQPLRLWNQLLAEGSEHLVRTQPPD